MKTARLIFAPLAICLSIGLMIFNGNFVMAEDKNESADKNTNVPVLGDASGDDNLGMVKIMHERSGILWRREVLGPDGKTPTEIHFGLRDNHRLVFEINTLGKVKRVRDYYPGAEKICYEVSYPDDSAQVEKWQQYRQDGSVAESFERLADGVETKTIYRANGTKLSQVIVNPDGSQSTVKFADDGILETSKDIIAATPNEESFAPNQDPEMPEYSVKVRRVGVKILDWDCTYPDGTIAHQGKFDNEGGITFTIYSPNGKLSHKQHWKFIAEDHLRKYYALDSIQEYDLTTSEILTDSQFSKKRLLTSKTYMYNNPQAIAGKLPLQREIILNPSTGEYVQFTYFPPGSDKPNNRWVLPTVNPVQVFARAQTTVVIPGSDNSGGTMYRLTGTPFEMRKLEGGVKLSPLFVE
jgi:antitoxin component YwqK of YwqJK toxin-antitoxin module